MLRFLAERLLVAALTLVLLSMMVFFIMELLMALPGLSAGVFAPYGPVERNRAFLSGPPQIPMVREHRRCPLGPFVHGTRTTREPETRNSPAFCVQGEAR